MLKLSKVSLWLLIVFGIAVVALNFAYHKQVQEQKALSEELHLIQVILVKPVVDRTPELRSALAEAQAELGDAEGKFIDPGQSLAISDGLYLLANSYDLVVAGMQMSVSNRGVGGTDYFVLRVAIDLKGKVVNFLAFIDELGREYATAEIESVNIVLAKSEGEVDTAEIDISIYTE